MRKVLKRAALAAIVGLAILLVVVLVYVRTGAFRQLVERKIEATAADITGRAVSIDLERLHPFTLQASIADLRIAGSQPTSPPFLAADTVRVDLPWSVVGGDPRITSLEASGLRVDLAELPEFGPEEETDASELSFARVLELVVIDHLDVRRGRLHVEERSVELDLVADGVRLRAQRGPADAAYRGSLEIAEGIVRTGALEPTSFRAVAGFVLDQDALALEDLRFDSDPLTLEGDLRLDELDPITYTAALVAEARPDRLEVGDASAGSLPRGTVRLEGTVSGVERRIRADVAVRADSLRWDPVLVQQLESRVVIDDDETRVEALAFRTTGVRVTGELHAGPWWAPAPLRGRLQLETADPGKLAALAGGIPELRGSLAGDVRFEAPSLEPDALRAELDVRARHLTTTAAPDLRVSADLEARLERGVLAIAPSRIEAPGATSRIEGSVAWDRATELSVAIAADDLGAFARTLPRVGRNDATGTAELDATLHLPPMRDFTIDAVTGDVALEAGGIGVGSAGPYAVRADAAISAGRIDCAPCEVEGPGLAVVASGGVGPDGPADLDVDLAAPTLGETVPNLLLLVEAVGLDAATLRDTEIRGALEASARLAGGWAALSGRVQVSAAELAVGTREIGNVEGNASLDAGRIAARIELAREEGDVEALVEGHAEIGGPDLEGDAQVTLRSGNGTLEVRADLSGSIDAPRANAELVVRGFEIAGHPVPDLAGPVAVGSDLVRAELRSPDAAATIDLNLPLDGEEPWTADLDYPLDLDLTALLHGSDPDTEPLPASVSARIDAELQMAMADPSTVSGQVRIADFRLEAEGRTLRVDATPVVRLEQGRVTLEPFTLRGPETNVTIDGSVALSDPWSADLDATGTIGLALAGALSPDLRAEGTAHLDVRVSAGPEDFDMRGTLGIVEGRVQQGHLPGVDRIEARVELDRDTARLTHLDARVGGGPVTAEGWLRFRGDDAWTFALDLRGERVRLAYPSDIRSESDVALRLEKDSPTGPGKLSGRIDLRRAKYDRPFDVRRELLGRTREFDPYAEALPDTIRQLSLDIDIAAEDGVWIQNDLITMESRVDIHADGTVRTPQVSGVVEGLDGASVVFRDVRYEVTRALLSFRGHPRINPLLDIRAETSIVDHDVILLVTGPLDEFKFELSSSPPLPEADIVALLITGRTRGDLASGAGGGLSQGEAARYLSRGFTDDVAATLQRNLGLDEVSIDPTLVQGETNPVARITLGKALSSRLYVVYSTLLGGRGGEDLYRARYRLTDDLRLVGGRDDDGSLSADIRYGIDRYVGPDAPGPSGAVNRTRIERLDVVGNEVASDRKVKKLLRSNEGSRFRRSTLLAGIDRVRDWYLTKGYPEVEVGYETEDDAGSRVLVTLDEGRLYGVDITGTRKPDRYRRLVLATLRDTVFQDTVEEAAGEAIRERLRSKGYVDAEVRASSIDGADGSLVLRFDVRPGRRVRVGGIAFEGAAAFAESRISAQVLTERSRFYDPEYLAPAVVEDDAASIRSLYVNNGYLDAETSYRVEYPTSDRRAVVTFLIDEGPRYCFGAVSYEGNDAFPDERLAQVTELTSGKACIDADLREAEERLLLFYDEQGHTEARVRLDPQVNAEDRTVRVVFDIDEGPRYTVAAVEVTNRGMTDEDVIRRDISLEPGAALSAEELSDSRHELYRTGLFRSVAVTRDDTDVPGEQRVVFDLEEGPNFQTGFGVGVDSTEGARVSADVGHHNLWGRRLYGGVGGHWSATDARLQALVRQPRFLGSRLDGLVSGFWEDLERESFEVESVGLSLQLGRRREKYTYNWGYDIRDNDILQGGVLVPGGTAVLDPVAGVDLSRQSDIRLASLVNGASRDSRDDVFWPTRGSYTRAELRLFHEALLSEADVFKAFFQWSRYQYVGDGLLWSSGIRIGTARPFGSTRIVPISERYFAGGEDTIRGFGRDEIEAVGFPAESIAARGITIEDSLGGNALLVVNQELLYPLRPPLHTLVFVDAGNVYWRLRDFDPSDVRWSAGLGLRFRTPAGPLRLEYGWKLDREPDEDPGELHFSLGLAF